MAEDQERLCLSILTLFRSPSEVANRRDEDVIRDEVGDDISNLFATINLAAALDLSDMPLVARSVLNYGIADMSRLTISDAGMTRAQKDIKEALTRFEPRLAATSVQILPREIVEDGRQHFAFDISAELRVEPVEMAISFSARIDIAASRVTAVDLKVDV